MGWDMGLIVISKYRKSTWLVISASDWVDSEIVLCIATIMKTPYDDLFTVNDITMTSWWARWCLKSPASRLFTQLFVLTQIKENIKAPRHWPLWAEFTGDRWIPAQKTSKAENVSIWWRIHRICHSGGHVGNSLFYFGLARKDERIFEKRAVSRWLLHYVRLYDLRYVNFENDWTV